MKKIIFISKVLTLVMIFFIACNPAKRIVKKKGISKECGESIVWLYNSLEKENGLLKLKVDNFETDTAFQYQVQKRFYDNHGICLFRQLGKEDVKKLYGEPFKITLGERTQDETFYYPIMTATCRDTIGLKKGNNTCGHIRFKFDKNGTPINGFLQFVNYGDLD